MTRPLAPQPIDRAFARFAREGDPDALAEVFDRAAPRLAILAAHLVPGDPQAVEDLVQTTFLEAIRSAPRFEAGRAVLPWLVAILGRRASNLRRDRRRRREAGDAAALGDATSDPALLAADRELAERTAEILDKLGAPYREVLALRLVHGLTPAEIARALARPVGTVHAQLHRGHEKLRRMLPASLAVVLAAVLAEGGLAAVRARVCEAARDAVPVPVATGTGVGLLGGLAMAKTVALCVLVVSAALALWWASSQRVDLPVSDVSGERAGPGVLQAEERVAREERGIAGEESRQALGAVAAALPITFVGRVVDAETGAPVAGAEVELILAPFSRYQGDPVEARDAMTTSEDGRYEVRLVPRANHYKELRIRAEKRAEMSGTWEEEFVAGAVVDSGDVPMVPGARLSLRVTDQDGEPVSSFGIQFGLREDLPRSMDGRLSAWGWSGIQQSGRDGIAGPKSVPVGKWEVNHAEGTGHRYVGPKTLEVPRGVSEVELAVSVAEPEPSRAVTGVLVDESGTPLEGVDVVARQDQSVGYRNNKSFGGGRFLIGNMLSERGDLEFLRVGPGTGAFGNDYEILEPREPVPLGTRGVKLVVRSVPRRSVSFRVVTQGGTPVEAFRWVASAVTHLDNRTRFGGDRLRRSCEHLHPGGVVRFDDLVARQGLLAVFPESDALQPAVFAEFDGWAPAARPLDVVVEPAVRWRVRVVDGAGAPIAGSRVELMRTVGRGKPPVSAYALEAVFDRGLWSTQMAVVTSGSDTDASGLAWLRTGADVRKCAVRVRGATHLESLTVLDAIATQDEERVVVVEPAARLRVRLGPPELVARFGPSAEDRVFADVFADPETSLQRARIRVELSAFVKGHERSVARAWVGDDGACLFESLELREYEVEVRLGDIWTRASLGRVADLSPGELREVTFDLERCLPVAVRGRVLLSGAVPPDGARLRIGGSYMAPVQGEFDCALPPGAYSYELEVRSDRPPTTRFRGSSKLVVGPPGGEMDVILHFERRRFDFHVTDRDGAPVAHKWIVLSVVDESGKPQRRATVKLDAGGRGSFESSLDAVEATLWMDSPRFGYVRRQSELQVELGRVAVPAGQTSASFTFAVDLPARDQ